MKKFLNNLLCKQTNKKILALSLQLNKIDEDLNKITNRLFTKFNEQSQSIRMLSLQNKLILEALGDSVYSDKNYLKKEFFQYLPRAVGKMSYLQKALYFMLLELKEVCNNNNISYWIQAGTLLGAYRHQGWIPWDDDLDVGMLEEDLRKLKRVLQNHPILKINDYYHFREGYLGRFTRVTFKDERFNVFLDIPVYEYYKGNNIDEAWSNILRNRQDFEKKIISLSHKLSKIYHNEIIKNEQDLELVKQFYDEEINKCHQKDGDFIYWASYSVPAGWKRIFPKEMFFPLEKLKFEDNYFSVPRLYEDYMVLQYGDIYDLPKDMEAKHVKSFNLFHNIELLSSYIEHLKENYHG